MNRLLQFFSGAMFNVFSSKKIYSFSLSTMIFGFFVLINSDNFAHLILSQVLIAIGASFGFIGAAHTSSICFPVAQFGLMFSMHNIVWYVDICTYVFLSKYACGKQFRRTHKKAL